MATLSQSRSIAKSLSSGKVFSRFRLRDDDVDALVESLNYATAAGMFGKIADLKSVASAVLRFLQERYPHAHKYPNNGPRSEKNIAEGFEYKLYATSGLVGFYIAHRRAKSERIRTIVASLEEGSGKYTIEPKGEDEEGAEALRFWGTKRKKWMFSKFPIEIPARRGHHFLAAAEAFANQLITTRGSTVANNLADLIDGASSKWKGISTAAEFNALPPDPDIVSARNVFLPRKSSPFKIRPRYSRSSVLRKKYFK